MMDRLVAALAARYGIERELAAVVDAERGVRSTCPFGRCCPPRPDGQRFFIRQRTEETSAATLVLDWRALLEAGGDAR